LLVLKFAEGAAEAAISYSPPPRHLLPRRRFALLLLLLTLLLPLHVTLLSPGARNAEDKMIFILAELQK
jgi:hypothetical protein